MKYLIFQCLNLNIFIFDIIHININISNQTALRKRLICFLALLWKVRYFLPGLPCSMWPQRLTLPARRTTETAYTEADTGKSESESDTEEKVKAVENSHWCYHIVTHANHLEKMDLLVMCGYFDITSTLSHNK